MLSVNEPQTGFKKAGARASLRTVASTAGNIQWSSVPAGDSKGKVSRAQGRSVGVQGG